MKKTLFPLFLGLLLTACTNDQDAFARIVGKWQYLGEGNSLEAIVEVDSTGKMLFSSFNVKKFPGTMIIQLAPSGNKTYKVVAAEGVRRDEASNELDTVKRDFLALLPIRHKLKVELTNDSTLTMKIGDAEQPLHRCGELACDALALFYYQNGLATSYPQIPWFKPSLDTVALGPNDFLLSVATPYASYHTFYGTLPRLTVNNTIARTHEDVKSAFRQYVRLNDLKYDAAVDALVFVDYRITIRQLQAQLVDMFSEQVNYKTVSFAARGPAYTDDYLHIVKHDLLPVLEQEDQLDQTLNDWLHGLSQ